MKKLFYSILVFIVSISTLSAQSRLDESTLIINNGDHYTKSPTVTLEVKTKGTAIQMMVSNQKNFGMAEWITYQSTIPSWQLSEGDGDKEVYVKLKDEKGNVSKPVSSMIVLDTKPPTNPSVRIYQGKVSNDNSLIVDLEVFAEDAQFVMLSNTKSFYGRKWQIFRKNFDGWSLAPGEDGPRTIYAKFKDAAQNESKVTSVDILIDTKAPFDGKVLINNGDEVTIQQDREATVMIFAREADSVLVSQNEGFEDAEWEAYQQQDRKIVFGEGDGKKMVYVKFKDIAGNVSQVYSDAIYLDITPPRDCSVVIDGGAEVTNHYDKKVTLELKAEGAAFVKISNLENFYGAKWQRYQPKIANWSLDGEDDGEKSVYVKFKDRAGNVSSVFSDAIVLKRSN